MDTVYVLCGIIFVFTVACFRLFHRYSKTNYKPSLYFGVACLLWVLSAIFGILIPAATILDSLPLSTLFYRLGTTLGVLAYVFLNMFAITMAKPGEKTRSVWLPVICFLFIVFAVWAFNPVKSGFVGGTTEFTLTSIYKAPYGLPLIEIVVASMIVIAIYPIRLFFRIAMDSEEKIIKTKSLLMGIGLFLATNAHAIEITDAISYRYIFIYRLMIFVGIFILAFGYMMPKWLERKLFGRAFVGEESFWDFVERFFVFPVAPTTPTQSHLFSKMLGINHQQMTGRKILFEFDPTSCFEEAIQDFATESLANVEPIFVFTPSTGPIHSYLAKQSTIKFFLTSIVVSIPKSKSENEVLLPAKNTPLILEAVNKVLETHENANVCFVFDILSDLLTTVEPEKTFTFLRHVLDMLSSKKVTGLFLLNTSAHQAEVVSRVRGLFNNLLTYNKNGLTVVKTP